MTDAGLSCTQPYDQSAWENAVWTFVFATVDTEIAYGGKRPASAIQRLLARGKAMTKRQVGLDLVPNPFFVLNGICDADDTDSPVTANYLC